MSDQWLVFYFIPDSVKPKPKICCHSRNQNVERCGEENALPGKSQCMCHLLSWTSISVWNRTTQATSKYRTNWGWGFSACCFSPSLHLFPFFLGNPCPSEPGVWTRSALPLRRLVQMELHMMPFCAGIIWPNMLCIHTKGKEEGRRKEEMKGRRKGRRGRITVFLVLWFTLIITPLFINFNVIFKKRKNNRVNCPELWFFRGMRCVQGGGTVVDYTVI